MEFFKTQKFKQIYVPIADEYLSMYFWNILECVIKIIIKITLILLVKVSTGTVIFFNN